MLAGRLIVDDLSSSGGGDAAAVGSDVTPISSELRWKSPLRRLLSPELKATSLLLWFIWLACAFCYYGMVLMSTELLAGAARAEDEGDCLNRNGNSGNISSIESCSAECRVLTTTDYTDLLWTTLAEFPGKLFKYRNKLFSYFYVLLLLFFCYRDFSDYCCDWIFGP